MFTAVSFAAIAGFALGVIFHKLIVSEAATIKAQVIADTSAIKAHVSSEIVQLRAEIRRAIGQAAEKL